MHAHAHKPRTRRPRPPTPPPTPTPPPPPPPPPPCIVILNASESTRNNLLAYFSLLHLPSINYASTSTRSYNSTIHFLSESSFILDLLNGVVQPSKVTGFVVFDPEKGVDGTTGMCCRVLRAGWSLLENDENVQHRFIILTSTNPLLLGSTNLPRLLSKYGVAPKNLLVYPRFRATSIDNIYCDTLSIPLAKRTKDAAVSILSIMTQIVSEMRNRASSDANIAHYFTTASAFQAILTAGEGYEYLSIIPPVDGAAAAARSKGVNSSSQYLSAFVGFPYISLFSVASNRVDRILYSYLDSLPNTVHLGLLRAYVSDLTSLSNMLRTLETSNAVSFLKSVTGLFTSLKHRDAISSTSTGWIASVAGLELLKEAEERIGTVVAGIDGTDTGGVFVPSSTGATTKIKVLLELVDEINTNAQRREEKRVHRRNKTSELLGGDYLSSSPILILADTPSSVHSITSAIKYGLKRHENLNYLRYLEQRNDRIKGRALSELSQSERWSLNAENRLRNVTFEGYHQSNQSNGDGGDSFTCELVTQEDFEQPPLVTVVSYAHFESSVPLLYLRGLRPQHIILHDANIAAVRAIEQYSETLLPAGGNKHEQLRVYYLHYNDSVTHYAYKRSLMRENAVWERIIETKSSATNNHLSETLTSEELELAKDVIQTGVAEGVFAGAGYASSRVGKGKKSATMMDSVEGRTVAVDVREFRSQLPSTLHAMGMRLAPVTLTVGDYVISGNVVVERKAPGDLRGSLASGRLYDQLEAMTLYYKTPVLLIEFEPGKRSGDTNFSLITEDKDLMSEVRVESIISKLAVLTMKYNKARYIWSRNPGETVAIFKSLKEWDASLVDVKTAVGFGGGDEVDKSLGLLGAGADEMNDEEEDGVNTTAVSILLKLPGINLGNVKKVMALCDNLAELSELSKEDLKPAMGVANANHLWSFFRVKVNERVAAVGVSGGKAGKGGRGGGKAAKKQKRK
jgi:ERCC4-type nuclease